MQHYERKWREMMGDQDEQIDLDETGQTGGSSGQSADGDNNR
jgi:hypothetical protein